MAVIDFHSHILPGIDDGSRDVATSLQMLHAAAEQGIDVMVATPHFYAGSTTPEQFLCRRETAFLSLPEQELSGLPKIICGAEVAYFSGISKADDIESLCIEGTNLLLLEMPFAAWTERNIWEIELLLNRGMQPVIAHLERFFSFQKDKHMISKLLDLPVCVQMNAECLLSWRKRRQVLSMFQRRQAHLLGSDCHNTGSRPQNLGEGRAVLERKLGQPVLEEMDELGAKLLHL